MCCIIIFRPVEKLADTSFLWKFTQPLFKVMVHSECKEIGSANISKIRINPLSNTLSAASLINKLLLTAERPCLYIRKHEHTHYTRERLKARRSKCLYEAIRLPRAIRNIHLVSACNLYSSFIYDSLREPFLLLVALSLWYNTSFPGVSSASLSGTVAPNLDVGLLTVSRIICG